MYREAILLGVGITSGIMNSVVGGGSFVAFPALIFLGLPPIAANATATISLWPGMLASTWAYRRELMTQTKILPSLMPLCLLGGGIGAVILLHMSNPHFSRLVPYLLLIASVLFSFRTKMIAWLKTPHSLGTHPTWRYHVGVGILQLVIAIYGGFFGAGVGIMLLALLGIMGMNHIHEMNAVRTCTASCINAVAIVIFIVAGIVQWHEAALMCIGAIIGGYGGAHYTRKLPPDWVRNIVITVAWGMTIYFFVK